MDALGLAGLVVVQILLGGLTWLAKYGWPEWVPAGAMIADFTVRAESPLQAFITTAHVANGSLILATAVVLALRTREVLNAAKA